ncbi:MAG TPA: alanine racemase [Candidatus Tenderia electrophaga]|uniref:Alanine racemase n=1 Tax=Candidatus Tenderia electrophaga TaxID=1748243 RepID=A0A832J5S3_9GAMM|nr:alanine racemase [Candidatus Tenderia electrophaga]
MTPAVEAHINLTALARNLERVRQAAPDSKIMAVIKANAYGHGMVQVANALAAADAFSVARLQEAVQLRQAGISKDITVLEGFHNVAELNDFSRYDLQPTLHQPAQIDLLRRTQLEKPIQVWLKIDSGMHRMGVAPEAVRACWKVLQKIESVSIVRLMTHLASADDRRSEQTEQQLDVFKRVTAGIEAETSIANSAGILGWPQTHTDWVRPGIMLYGVSPFLDGWGEDEGLELVMTLTSRLIAVKHFKEGDAIGYGASWTCPEDMPIGVVSCGYGDGYPRHAVPGTLVMVNGVPTPLLGRVSMDTICVDLRQQPDAEVGDIVLLWGESMPVEEIAQSATTIPYEVLCSVTQRVQFQYIT